MFVALYVLVIFTHFTENIMKWKIYIPWFVVQIVFFLVCRIGFGGPNPIEPTYSYKFNWDIVTPYYGFIGLFPEVIILCIWAMELVIDLIFFLFLRRGVKVEDLEE
jgi:hypothetical protein